MDDKQLLDSALKGDRDAFRVLVNDNSRRLYSLAWRIVGDEQLAEDIVQESFIKAYRQMNKFDGRSTVSTWLYRITTNTAIDMKRKMIRQQTTSIDAMQDDGSSFAMVDQGSSLDNKQHQLSLRKQTALAMEQLTLQEKTVFTLKHHDGRSINEICNILDLTESSVKQAIFRSVKKLRTLLAPLLEDELSSKGFTHE